MKLLVISLVISFILTQPVLAQSALAPSPEQVAFFEARKNLENSILIRSSEIPGKFLDDKGQVDILQVRQSCEYLTNDKFKNDFLLPLPKRKTLLKLVVIDICETIELGIRAGVSKPSDYSDLLQTLNITQSSFYNKSQIDQGFSILDILKIGFWNEFSPLFLKFSIPEKLPEIHNPPDSAFWKNLTTSSERKNRYDKVAELKRLYHLPRVVEFNSADGKGSSTKFHVTDPGSQMHWLMKLGDEVHSDVVVSRLFSALGFYVDNSYFFSNNLILVFPKNKDKIHSIKDLARKIYSQYKVNISPFVKQWGTVDQSMIQENSDLKDFLGRKFVVFSSAALEARSNFETRLGAFMPNLESVFQHREVRGALLAHLWLNSWDIKSDNTLLAFVETENHERKTISSFSDMGLSLGVTISKFPRDMKGGLVNHYSWEMLEVKNGQIVFKDRVNAFTQNYINTTYEDLRWMAQQIAQINVDVVTFCLSYSGWPSFLQELYLHKIMHRRNQILKAFEIKDPYTPFTANKDLNLKYNDRLVVKNGVLLAEPDLRLFPEGLLHDKGRFRGFGW